MCVAFFSASDTRVKIPWLNSFVLYQTDKNCKDEQYQWIINLMRQLESENGDFYLRHPLNEFSQTDLDSSHPQLMYLAFKLKRITVSGLNIKLDHSQIKYFYALFKKAHS
jgi:hypothetical protein